MERGTVIPLGESPAHATTLLSRSFIHFAAFTATQAFPNRLVCTSPSLCTSKPMHCRFALSILKEQERKHESVCFCIVRAEMLKAQSFAWLLDSQASSFTVTTCPQAPRGHSQTRWPLQSCSSFRPIALYREGVSSFRIVPESQPPPLGVPTGPAPGCPNPAPTPHYKHLLWLVFYSCIFKKDFFLIKKKTSYHPPVQDEAYLDSEWI